MTTERLLPLFSEASMCPKCGAGDPLASWQKNAHHDIDCPLRSLRDPQCCSAEHIERVCRRCHYHWAEGVLW